MKRRGAGALAEQLKYQQKANRKIKIDDPVQTWLQLPRGNKAVLPARFQHEDVRYADSLVEFCIDKFTEKGQVVFDPFTDSGTTLLIAEEMGRVGYGIEYSQQKADYIHGLLQHPERLIHGDSRNLLEYDLPGFEASTTT